MTKKYKLLKTDKNNNLQFTTSNFFYSSYLNYNIFVLVLMIKITRSPKDRNNNLNVYSI